jgi:FdhD protein
MSSMRFRLAKPGTTGTRVYRVRQGDFEERPDELATEEPLEIRLIQGGRRRTVAVTMRTPGADAELALGFLFAEGVIHGREDVRRVAPCIDVGGNGDNPEEVAAAESRCANVMEVELADGLAEPELAGLERHFFATSACGVCGKASLDALTVRLPGAIEAGPEISAAVITALPERLRAAQGMFATTGGLHAAALFDARGELLAVREDVGRHNALDKLIGWALGAGLLPLAGHVVLVSGRSSYEILQKSLMAGVPVVCAVSAPSSLAVELAERFGLTLIGFLRGDRFNVYSGVERVAGAPARNLLPVL